MQKPITDLAEKDFSNNVLVEKKDKDTIYYLPCYVCFKVKAITGISIADLKGSVSGTLIFSFYYGYLQKHILSQFVGLDKKQRKPSRTILMQFSRQESIELKQEKDIVMKWDKDQMIVTFTIRKQFNCELDGQTSMFPFTIINLYLMTTLQTIKLNPKQNCNEKISIRFNCMDSSTANVLSHGKKNEFGDYTIAVNFLQAKFANSETNTFKEIRFFEYEKYFGCCPVCKEEEDEAEKRDQQPDTSKLYQADDNDSREEILNESSRKIKMTSKVKDDGNFQFAQFRIALYKFPGSSILSIFVPLWILGFINLFIFFQDRTLSDRIAAIATLTLAFIAFIPTINEQVPKTPQLKIIDMLIYLEVFASVLCLIQSFLGRDYTDEYDWSTDPFYIATIALNLLTIFVELTLFIVHKAYWERKYLQEGAEKYNGLRRAEWSNPKCDKIFKQRIGVSPKKK